MAVATTRVRSDGFVWSSGAWRSPESLRRRQEYFRHKRVSIRRFLSAVKVTAGCIDCGYDEYPVAIDFDHRDDKRFLVSAIAGRHWNAVVDEVMKCDVRCSNCHRVKTQRDRGGQ